MQRQRVRRVISDRPADNDSVRSFAAWWMRNKPLTLNVPDGVRWNAGFAGITLYRDGPFQVQLFVVKPNAASPRHAHPNIDSVEYGIAGSDTFDSDRNLRIGGLICVAPNEMHTAAADDEGGAFFSIQKWLNGVQPSSVELDWTGAPIDQHHAAELAAN